MTTVIVYFPEYIRAYKVQSVSDETLAYSQSPIAKQGGSAAKTNLSFWIANVRCTFFQSTNGEKLTIIDK